MNKILIIVVIALLLSCMSKDKQKDSPTVNSENYKKLDTLISFSGSWVSEDYYNSIIKDKSPLKAQDGSQFIIIPARTLQEMTMIYNFHEGRSSLTIVKNDVFYEVWGTREDSLTQFFYEIKIISPSKIIMEGKPFIKIISSIDLNELNVLEEILFKGIYINTEGKNIEFKSNGHVNGMDNFQYYNPLYDYAEEGMEIDQIRLGKSPTEWNMYGFKFHSDTLEIYTINCIEFSDSTSNYCVEVDYGQLFEKMWRVNE